MMRTACISAVLGFLLASGFNAGAKEVPLDAPLEFRPMMRSSTDIFNVLTQFMTAKEHYAARNYAQSYDGFSVIVLHDPDNIEALFGLGNSALALHKSDIAYKAFNRLSKLPLTPEQNLKCLSGNTLVRIMDRRSSNPERDLHKALKTIPSDPRLWNALGQFYDSQSLWDKSWSAYQSARAAGFDKAGFHNNLGMSFLQQEKYQGAISHFSYAVALEPENLQYDNNRRFALLMDGKYLKALQNLNETQSADLLSDAGYIAIQKEDFTLARILLEKAIDISPTYNQRAAENLEKLALFN